MFIIHISNLLRMNDIRVSKTYKHAVSQGKWNKHWKLWKSKKKGGGGSIASGSVFQSCTSDFGSSHISPDFCNKSQKRNTKFIKYHATKEKWTWQKDYWKEEGKSYRGKSTYFESNLSIGVSITCHWSMETRRLLTLLL